MPHPYQYPRKSFDAMIAAYTSCGGTARADELAQLLEHHKQGNFVNLAKWLVSGEVFSFEWQNHFWVPMFQFNPQDMTVKQDVRRVAHELACVLDNWTLAWWFTEPNAWLRFMRPVDLVNHQFSDVLCAARADRFVATGKQYSTS